MLRTRLTLKPGRSGTRDLVEQYGSKLVCVRYRYDDELGIRYKTVELIVDEKPWKPPTARYRPTDLVHVRIEGHESQLRDAIKLLGGRYHRPTGTWLVAYAAVTALRLLDRITPISTPPTRISPRSGANEGERERRHDDEMAALQWQVGVGSK
jgi:hypothetical protein